MKKADRRVKRTQETLQQALMDLIAERGYETVTVQDILDQANVGRTTFYEHYTGKDDLFMSCHEAMVRELRIGLLHPLTREELLSAELPPDMALAYRHLEDQRAQLYPIFQGRDSPLILRQIRERSAREIEANLRSAFAESDSTIPLELLANYLAGAQVALMQWWLEKRRPHAASQLAETLHRMQRAAIREAFGL